ncbi:primosomal protein N' [Leucobacter alluvii]|uniref:Primosomal protein N n=1 Tax=Leucobacter alluvii TaxID=340321 RepID=A0ABP5MX49_9MICO
MPAATAFTTAESAQGRPIAQILLDSALPQLDHLFDYAVPPELADDIRVGQRVRVPFRSKERKTFGYVIGFTERSDFGGELSPIADIVTLVPVLSTEVWRLARAVADRAGGSAGDILRLAIPTRQVRVEKQHLAARAAAEADATTPDAAEPEVEEPEVEEPGTPEQGIAEQLVGGSRLALTASHGPDRLHTGEWVGGWAVQLARTALAVHALGRSAILIAPDYRDLDQLRDALAALGHEDVVRVDSRQSNAERYAGFLRARDPEPRVILGNRSAVYAPAHALGAIIMWDDGDPLLAEPLAPYVHARDAALVRAEQESAGLFFAAHARSAEVQRLVDLGYVHAQRNPPKRARVVHADASLAPDAFAGRVPEFAARTIREGLRTGPVLVQVATPGYAPVAVCEDCGDLARCGVCNGPIGFRVIGRASCRWCGEYASDWHCRTCDGRRLVERGMGSGRTVEQFERQFEGARVLLSDGEHPRERVDARPAIVVATRGAEPLAAGGYRAVVLLDAERLLSIETLRAGEDCLRWWENVAALTAPDGVCLMASGGGPVVRAFVTGRADEWLHGELRDRHALRYPPAVRVASVSGGPEEVQRALQQLESLPGVDHLGPTPLPPGGIAKTPQGLVRAIVRFDYGHGAEVARRLRGALVSDAAGSASRTRGRAPGRARPEALRLRFDDRGVFDG